MLALVGSTLMVYTDEKRGEELTGAVLQPDTEGRDGRETDDHLHRRRQRRVHPRAARRHPVLPRTGAARLGLHDIDAERLETAEAIARATARRPGRSPRYVHHRPRRALDGADFVINAVAVGGHAATVTDFEVPARYGLKQTIADTLGVGGIFRALRTFPVLDGIAEDMAQVCPDAWLLNYTNPMAMNVTYLGAPAPAT